jgi:hypothetical protein
MQGTPGETVDFGGSDAAADGNMEEGFVVDFSQVGDSNFVVLPRGVYDAQVDDCTYGLSQSSGNPMWTWKFEIEGGEFNGRKLFSHSVFTPAAMPRTKKVIGVVAPELLNGPFNPKEVAESGVLLGRKVRIRLDVKKYEGQDRNNVRDVLAPAAEAGGGSFLG